MTAEVTDADREAARRYWLAARPSADYLDPEDVIAHVLADQRAAEDGLRAGVTELLDLFAGGPDTVCRTTWHEGMECCEVPTGDLFPVLRDLEAALDPHADGTQ